MVASIVFYYNDLPDALAGLIERTQQTFSKALKGDFLARGRREIHATLVGLEPAPSASTINYEGLLEYLCSTFKRHPLKIQFGGFDNEESSLSSRGRPLSERTVWCENGLVTLIGWPIVSSSGSGKPYDALDKIRRNCQSYHVIHKYHETPYATDPDMYLVIGSYQESANSVYHVHLAAKETRSLLSNTRVLVEAGGSNLKVVLSEQVSLPYSSSLALPMCEPDTLTKVHHALLLKQKGKNGPD